MIIKIINTDPLNLKQVQIHINVEHRISSQEEMNHIYSCLSKTPTIDIVSRDFNIDFPVGELLLTEWVDGRVIGFLLGSDGSGNYSKRCFVFPIPLDKNQFKEPVEFFSCPQILRALAQRFILRADAVVHKDDASFADFLERMCFVPANRICGVDFRYYSLLLN